MYHRQDEYKKIFVFAMLQLTSRMESRHSCHFSGDTRSGYISVVEKAPFITVSQVKGPSFLIMNAYVRTSRNGKNGTLLGLSWKIQDP